MSTSNDTRRPKLSAVPTTDRAADTAQEVERAAYRAAASVAVLWRLLLEGCEDDRVAVPASILADYVEGIDRELDFVTNHIGSMKIHDGLASRSAT